MAKREIINNDAVTVRVSESVTDAVENALDTVSDTLDVVESQVERVVTVTKNNPWMIVGAFALGAGIAGFFAYKWAEKKVTLHYEELITEEIEQARTFYSRLNKEGSFETPEAAVAALAPEKAADALISYSGTQKVPYNKPGEIVVTTPVEDPRPDVRNVFADRGDPRDWDYVAEQRYREENPGVPYVISSEEFEENPDHHEQITLTYFAGDEILADETDKVVEDIDQTVNVSSLSRFGEGSQDNKVVYVRNERISADFEILLSEGAYSVEVLGAVEGELKHSAIRHPNRPRTNAPRRFRERDDG